MPGASIQSGERVTLRTVEREDVPFVQRSLTNPELRYPIGNPVMSRKRLEEHVEDEDSDHFLVCLDGSEAESNQPDVTITDFDWKRPELGYWLVPEVHGQGYGTEAVSIVIDYAFRTYDTPAIGAEAFDFNDASRGLLESLGFAEEGRRRKYMFIDGEHRDMIQYGLLREEWVERE
ncbi:GNAT family N-acetyltransferase [Haladaptatus sp. DFWS20]|uniref:GNAT family N-acetyltransferase n=1 Tax=Haladaptatus sp. DFWS20 TaxID=3403467 RepID=UPI003EB69E23